eukprot:3789311-Rhodomonas_salina.2
MLALGGAPQATSPPPLAASSPASYLEASIHQPPLACLTITGRMAVPRIVPVTAGTPRDLPGSNVLRV